MRRLLILTLLLVSPAAAAPVHWPVPDWSRARPASQRLDEERLQELVGLIREERYPDLHSLLIVKNGHLVLEEYFAGHGPDRLHTLQSVSKSFTSALIGIAIEQGAIKGVDEKVLDFFSNTGQIRNLDDRKRAMTLEDLLTMRSGTDYHEGYPSSPHSQLNRLRRGWDRFVLNRPMVSQPGTRFRYDSGGVILMSTLLRNRTGMHADAFAERYLFRPLQISRWNWLRNEEGHPHTGGGLHLTSRDMARFGLLYLRRGRWEGRQVVPEAWVLTSTRQHVTFQSPRSRSTGYGYLWWILPPDPTTRSERPIYAAVGFRAQYIFLVPEHDMVVVVTGGTQSSRDQERPVQFLYSHILKAVLD